MKVTRTILLVFTLLIDYIYSLQLLHGNIRRAHNSDILESDTNSAGQFPIYGQKKGFSQQSFQVYGQSVINVDGMLEKSLAAVVRVPREQPRNEIMLSDEPDTKEGKNQNFFNHIRYPLTFAPNEVKVAI